MKAPRKQRDLQAQLKGNEGMLLKLVLKESGLGLLTQKHEYETDVNKLSTISNQAMRKKVIECLRSKISKNIQSKSNIRDKEMSSGYNPVVEDPHNYHTTTEKMLFFLTCPNQECTGRHYPQNTLRLIEYHI